MQTSILRYDVTTTNIPFAIKFMALDGSTAHTSYVNANAHGIVLFVMDPVSFPLAPGYYYAQLVDAQTLDTLFGTSEFAWDGATAVNRATHESLGIELEHGVSVLQALRYQAAVLLGKSAVNGRVEVFKGLDGVTDRVSSTTTDDGGRTAVMLFPDPEPEFGSNYTP